MTFDEAIARVDNDEAGIKEVFVDSGLSVADENTLLVGDLPFRLEGAGFARWCDQLSAPADYLNDLPARLRRLLMQHHVDCIDIGHGHLSLVAREGRFLAFRRRDLHQLRGAEVLEAVQNGAGRTLDVKHLAISEVGFQVDLLVENESEEVAVGDIVSAGIHVSHSAIGEHATSVVPYFYRLVCRNGLTRRECGQRKELSRTRRMPSERADAREIQIEQVRRLAFDTCSSLRQKLEVVRKLKDEQVDVNHLMSRFLERGGMSTRLWLPRLRRAWEMEGSEATAYGVMNAMTRIATHGSPDSTVSARHRRVFGGLAGILAFRELHICPRCFSALKSPVSNN
jgi:hypothetical protein